MAQQGYGQPQYGAPPPPGGMRPPGAPSFPPGPGFQQQQPQQQQQQPQYGMQPGMRPPAPGQQRLPGVPQPNGLPSQQPHAGGAPSQFPPPPGVGAAPPRPPAARPPPQPQQQQQQPGYGYPSAPPGPRPSMPPPQQQQQYQQQPSAPQQQMPSRGPPAPAAVPRPRMMPAPPSTPAPMPPTGYGSTAAAPTPTVRPPTAAVSTPYGAAPQQQQQQPGMPSRPPGMPNAPTPGVVRPGGGMIPPSAVSRPPLTGGGGGGFSAPQMQPLMRPPPSTQQQQQPSSFPSTTTTTSSVPSFGGGQPLPRPAMPMPPGGAVGGGGGFGAPPLPPSMMMSGGGGVAGGGLMMRPPPPSMGGGAVPGPPLMGPPSSFPPPQQQQQQQSFPPPPPPMMMMGSGGSGAAAAAAGGGGGGGPHHHYPPQAPGMMMMPPGPPMMGGGGGGGGYDGSGGGGMGMMASMLDDFETLNLGGGGGGGGMGMSSGQQPLLQAVDAATFPRPAGSPDQEHVAVGPPPPYSTFNCGPAFLRMATQAVPNSAALKSRWHLPLGAVVHPLAESGGHVPVANATSSTIVRCKRCRTYMNPFMTWSDGGRRFSCNVCALVNECPMDYFASLDNSGRRLDINERPELSSGSVEYIAPVEYMVRPPMPPTYVFVLDVSFTAVASGLVAAACAAIKDCLDRLPGDDRTRVGILTFDTDIHFYNMRPGLSAPQMMVVPEIDDPFVPLPDELLVNLREGRSQVERLLETIPASFARNQKVDSAMGPALQAAFLVMSHVGGKLLLFQSATPTLGIGKIKARDNPALYGTDREYALRSPDDPFYKRFSAEASRFQICIDVFAAGSTFQDLPSLGALAKYTGGQVYYYPGFSADKDGAKLTAEVDRNLTRETTWEAVMRIRCSKGLKISSFLGHFFVRSTDLLALPACDADKSFSVEIQHEETVLTGQTAYIQSALLYTSSYGERRIRVHTAALPVVSDLIDLYKSSDAGAIATLMGKMAVERSLSTKLDDVRVQMQQRLAAGLREYRLLHSRGVTASGPALGAMVLPERLKSLPVLVLGLLKTTALRGSGKDVNTDERAAVGAQIVTAPVVDIVKLCYPSCYRVDDRTGDWGRPRDGEGPSGQIVLPSTAPAGLEYFDPTGAYLIDNSRIMVLWLGTNTPQQFYQEVLGAGVGPHNASTVHVEPPREGSDLSARICAVAGQMRFGRELRQEVHVVVQGTPMEAHVMPYFIEDRMSIAGGLPGYLDWMMQLQKQVVAKQ